MSPRLQNQIVKSKEDALAAFVSKKAEIDEMLTRLQALSDDHFNYSPDDIDWGHVGTLGCHPAPLPFTTAVRRSAAVRAATAPSTRSPDVLHRRLGPLVS